MKKLLIDNLWLRAALLVTHVFYFYVFARLDAQAFAAFQVVLICYHLARLRSALSDLKALE